MPSSLPPFDPFRLARACDAAKAFYDAHPNARLPSDLSRAFLDAVERAATATDAEWKTAKAAYLANVPVRATTTSDGAMARDTHARLSQP